MITKGELRETLIQQGHTEESLKDKSKQELVDMVEELNSLDAAESVEDEPKQDNTTENTVEHVNSNYTSLPEMPQNRYSPEWNDYILELLEDDEKRDGHPTVDGLRRIADQLYHVISVQSEVCECPRPDNEFHATVKVSITTEDEYVEACADAGKHNTPATFAIHAVATAESRAEGRAYRKLLRLRNVISAEENVDELEIVGNVGEKITDPQKNVISNVAKKLNINVLKWLESKGIPADKINNISRIMGQQLCGDLNTLQNSGEVIDEEVLGYDENWRN